MNDKKIRELEREALRPDWKFVYDPLEDENEHGKNLLRLLEDIRNILRCVPARFTARDLTGKELVVTMKSGNYYKGTVFVQEESGLWIECTSSRTAINEPLGLEGEMFLPLSAIESVGFTG